VVPLRHQMLLLPHQLLLLPHQMLVLRLQLLVVRLLLSSHLQSSQPLLSPQALQLKPALL